MTQSKAIAGYFHNGVPYNRVGHGPRNLFIFQGLGFENKPLPARMTWLYSMYYKYLEEDYTTYIVLRKPGLPDGYSMQNMADDYAAMIKEEFGGPVDVIGVSTGGSIAHHFAADHPALVRKLIIHSSAYTLSDSTKSVQMRVGHLARQRQWRAVYATMFSPMLPHSGAKMYIGANRQCILEHMNSERTASASLILECVAPPAVDTPMTVTFSRTDRASA